MLGFLATAVVLPVLGVVVVARFDGLDRLGQQVGKRFAIVFTLLIYLSIGPVLASPVPPLFPSRWRWPPICRRVAIPPCGCCVLAGVLSGGSVAVYDTGEAGEPHRPLPDPQSAGAAGISVRWLSVPGRGERGPVPDAYDAAPFLKGFSEGYQTMDTIAALNFGLVIATTLGSFA